LHNKHAIEELTENQVYNYGLFLIDKILYNSNISSAMCALMPNWNCNWGLCYRNHLIVEKLAWDYEQL
ncbi:15901_t:CDS:1, partial [Cetraspora pellucida]